jgi:hypothetical protein
MKIIIPFLLTFIFIIFMGCKSCDNYPKDFFISVGSGGGATGMWSGYLLDSNGTVFKWQGRQQDENPMEYQKLPKDGIKSIWTNIKQMNLIETLFKEPSNMSKSISFGYDGKKNTIIWGNNPTDSMAIKFNKLYDFIFNILEKK